ncbi:MAG: hypothetical protein HYW49_05140 [Deltaproteobacteria bacterium]|nr:hypothetical protein [Deltaproteobacteria bacterium]
MSEIGQSTKLFNTAVIATKIPKGSNSTDEVSGLLHSLVQSAPFQAILKSIREHAALQGIPEAQAAEEIVRTFREIDNVWNEYIFQEGLDRLKAQLPCQRPRAETRGCIGPIAGTA